MWDVIGKEVMICVQRPAGVVCVQVHMNNQQTTGRMLGKGSGPLPQSSTLVCPPRTMRCIVLAVEQRTRLRRIVRLTTAATGRFAGRSVAETDV